jgi:hypothetical protein
MSSVHDSQHELIQKAIVDQEWIGWHMAMQGYLSRHWKLAISANHHLEENNDKGKVWVRKTAMLLWDFGGSTKIRSLSCDAWSRDQWCNH